MYERNLVQAFGIFLEPRPPSCTVLGSMASAGSVQSIPLALPENFLHRDFRSLRALPSFVIERSHHQFFRMLSCGARQHEDNTEISTFLGSARICKAECHLSYTNHRTKQLSWVALEYRKGTTVPWGVQKERHAHGIFLYASV